MMFRISCLLALLSAAPPALAVGLDQSQVQHRTERLAAGNEFYDDIIAAAERHRRGHIPWALIVEGDGLHDGRCLDDRADGDARGG